MSAATKLNPAPKCRPILFSAPMVRALLAGTKTQTRRVMKPQPPDWTREFGQSALTPEGHHEGRGYWRGVPGDEGPGSKFFRCPYGQPGDQLWVRETFALESSRGMDVNGYEPPHKDGRPVNRVRCESWGDYWEQPHYRATDPAPELAYDDRDEPGVRWKPSIFMPRWASRIALDITEVRVQRLQDISEEDAKAEGVERMAPPGGLNVSGWRGHRFAYGNLWDLINGEGSWALNPWVWAISFRRSP